MSKITYHVSGHIDLTDDEWTLHYVPLLQRAVARGASFVVGEARGADARAQAWLHENGVIAVTVFHMLTRPRANVGSWPTIGGFADDESRDAAMTAASTHDLAWVRLGRENSGTAKNLLRRVK